MHELLGDGLRSKIFKYTGESEKSASVCKIPGLSGYSKSELLNEYDIVSQLKIDGIRQPLKTGIIENKQAFYYQYFSGIPLKKFLSENSISPVDFLKIARNISTVIKSVHDSGVLHLRLNSNNILIHPSTMEIHIIDFTLATFSADNISPNFEDWEEELVYIAPEQTKHFNKKVDTRTDLYSLGIVLYELWSRNIPFSGTVSSEIIHSHLVNLPPPLKNFRKDTPSFISAILGKLLEKNPDSRYQTAAGLIADFDECLTKLNEKKDFQFAPGNFDFPEHLILTQNLHGRNKELELLTNSFDKVKDGGKDVFFISGDSGVGKTALAQEFYRYVEENSGIFLSGSFNKLMSDVPNRAIIHALEELATKILSLSDKKLEEWKEVLLLAVDDIGQLLIDLVPEFKWVIGAQKPVPELSASQMENRINFLFYRLLKEIANPGQPVVIFVDNFQSADSASWKTFMNLIEADDINHVIFIFCYKNPEDTETKNKLQRLFDGASYKSEIIIENLALEDIVSFLNDSFRIKDVEEFSQIVYKKTHGNPFFLHKFLHSLYEEKKLVLVPKHQHWEWDKDETESFELAGNVVDYMSKKIKSLDEAELKILKKAACMGNSFQVDVLSELTQIPSDKLLSAISGFETQDFIIKQKSEFKFAHERIQEVAYELIKPEERSFCHYSIFLALKKGFTDNENPAFLFNLVNHLTLGFSHIPEDQKNEMAFLLFEASGKAKRSASFELAYKYIQLCISLLQEADWNTHYEKLLSIYIEAAENGMIVGDFANAESYLQLSLQHAKSIEDRSNVYAIRINHLCESHRFTEAVTYLLKVLDEIGYGIKRNPGKLTILKELAQVKWQFRGKSTDDILNLPEMQDERAKAFVKLTVMSSVAIFGSAPDILPIINFRQTRLALKYGNSEFSPYSYSAYGFAITAFLGDINKGYELAKMSLQLIEKNDNLLMKAKVMVLFYAFLSYWKGSLIESINPLKDAYLIGRQTGDLLYASFAASFFNQIRIYAGHNLHELRDSLTGYCTTIKNLNQDLVYIITEIHRQFVLNLVNKVEEPWILQQDDFNEDQSLLKLEELNDEASKFDIYFYKLMLACLFNNYEIGYENAELARKYEEETTSRQIPYPSFLFFSAMAFLKSEKHNPGGLTSKNKKIAVKKISLLKSFAKYAPQNFENKHTLLEAFLLEASGSNVECTLKYQKAVELSAKSNFIHEEAIAREHFAYFLINIGQREFGELMIQKAYQCFQKWGAENKCRQLSLNFPEIFGKIPREADNTISGFQNVYDLNTIIKSNRVLSSENTLDGLLRKMVELVISNASCTKVVIALKNDEKYLVPFAIGTNEKITIFNEDDDHPEFELPKSVVHYVSHSKVEFSSPNLKQDTRYKFDEYVRSKLPVSVCCIPIVSNNILLGVIYLENNLAESAFDKKRINFFKTISAQLAISLDNVMLYNQMEQKVRIRTSELIQKNEELTNEKRKSDSLLLNILPSETAEELKNFGKTTAKRYEQATILFCDIKNFTSISEKLSAEELVSELDVCFKRFDEIASENGLEKIKTIGDAYMAVGGVPENNSAMAEDVVRCSLHMQEFIKNHALKRKSEGKPPFEIRVGINTGPVVAGVVGTKKFQFDIWGEAVNVAARMEQHGEPGKVNISNSTYELVKDKFNCVSRGKISAKNMGETAMYFVESNKIPEFR